MLELVVVVVVVFSTTAGSNCEPLPLAANLNLSRELSLERTWSHLIALLELASWIKMATTCVSVSRSNEQFVWRLSIYFE